MSENKTITMKTLLIIAIFSLISCSSYTQDISVGSNIKVKDVVYDISKSGNNFQVNNVKNKLYRAKMFIPNSTTEYALNAIKTNTEERQKVTEIINKILSSERLRILNGEQLHIKYFINDRGEIIELYFLVPNSSKFNLIDLCQIEKGIKTSYKFKLINDSIKGCNFISFFWVVKI